ncbi:MAG: hypothetical protein ABIH69_07885 [bacterium]|nr:hypothetical protein [Candidatus Margulisiibacteriota bacterium]
MKFDSKYFKDFKFTKEQITKLLKNARKDFDIATKDKILDVKFNYTYTAFLKTGIALLSSCQAKTKPVPGHHIKIIEKMSQLLKDKSIEDIGNIMRSKRNIDMYAGGTEITDKECQEYLLFVKKVISQAEKLIFKS